MESYYERRLLPGYSESGARRVGGGGQPASALTFSTWPAPYSGAAVLPLPVVCDIGATVNETVSNGLFGDEEWPLEGALIFDDPFLSPVSYVTGSAGCGVGGDRDVFEDVWFGYGENLLGGGASLASQPPLLHHPRKDAVALSDHTLYCRKTEPVVVVDDEFMDPLYMNNENWETEFAEARELCGDDLGAAPEVSSSNLCSDGLPQLACDDLEFLKRDDDGLPSTFDGAEEDVNWPWWTNYLEIDASNSPFNVPDSADVYASTSKPVLHDMVPVKSEQHDDCDAKPPMESVSPLPMIPKDEIDVPLFEEKPSLIKIRAEAISAKHRASIISSITAPQTRRGRPKKERKPENKKLMSASDRRRAMNRDAALRYRERKKNELDHLKIQQYDLEQTNSALRVKENSLLCSIADIKLKLRDVGCPVYR